MSPLLFLVLVVVLIVVSVLVKNRKQNEKWLAWPTIEQYWARHPSCKTSSGTRCYKCGSGHFQHFGWGGRTDNRRLQRCNQCMTFLYRTLS